ncbi:facilitated trehalose transporter Tret1 [Drosophila novamexicana]|uniref:facilitated trehalose transporter Tret1 n=1 Tax=Drosophila novamexicana TaxID=47314 RepID=UPI0011E5A7C7|nr:facilitated trehalose transporter Tret1 [Drosophila novamexicana]
MKFPSGALFEHTNCLLNRRNRYQFLATFLVNISTFAHGIGVGWMSPVMRQLQTPESPLSFEVFVEELSWIGSLLGIGSVIGNLLAGFLQDRIGRKPIMFALTVPYVCFWLLSYFAQSVEYLYLARLLAGITGGGGYIVFPIFISEISDAKVRGRLSSFVMLSVNMGVLVGYILSTNVGYFTAPFCIIPLPICYFISNLFLPETPFHLINKGKFGAAEKSFRFYKNVRDDDKRSMLEFEDMKLMLTKERALNVNAFNYKDFATRPALKAYAIAMVLILSNQFTGTFCFITYMSDTFALSHTTLDISMCTIVIGAVQIVGTYTTTLICDRFGRKILLLISTLGAGICLAAFGCFTYLAKLYDLSVLGWLPLLLLSLDVFLCNIGLVGVFFVVLVEVMPAKIRSVAVSTFVVILSCTVFVSLKIFPLCMQYWGISITMWSSSLVAFVSFVYFMLFLDETKGKSLLDS